MNVKHWLENIVKARGPISPKDVYAEGKKVGITRKEIKAARCWHGKYVNTEICGDRTLWRWMP
ncbi:hypothetical protein H8711_04005 [Clostridiaceae bacterium NSJ-31]|uniref:Uncharacterized protein n=1 Tax=Ligaoa zhengdingensis TaxID=2763658 RepID=A0A926DVG8_9FIRM|nr:hypothetical protein [Ligaoa zhengdingensis]MBC8546098.1 hypothetical protein [Ligaoa zhengdingensis]